MCIWSKADDAFAVNQRRIRVSDDLGRTVKRRLRRPDYVWDLDDGAPGFLKRTKRDRLKLYVDSDRNGLFTRGDVLLGRAKLTRRHRRSGAADLLPDGQVGQIIAFNAPESTSPDSTTERQTSGVSAGETDDHITLLAGVGLRLNHPDGSVVAVFSDLTI